MARRPDPPDDDDAPPSRRKSAPRTEDRPEAAVPPRRAAEPEPEAEPEPVERQPKPLSELSDKGLVKRLLRYTEEFQILSGDSSPFAVQRRVELTRAMRAVQAVRDAREPIVEVSVPRSVTGEPFVLGPAVFPPGIHYVRASVAQYLLWLIGENQRIERQRLQANNRSIDLGTIGSRARLANIARDDGRDDWTGRGT